MQISEPRNFNSGCMSDQNLVFLLGFVFFGGCRDKEVQTKDHITKLSSMDTHLFSGIHLPQLQTDR